MRVVPHSSTTDHILAGECTPAPCTKTVLAGVQTITTYWQLVAEERETLAAGGLVRIEVMGGLPPVAVSVEPRA